MEIDESSHHAYCSLSLVKGRHTTSESRYSTRGDCSVITTCGNCTNKREKVPKGTSTFDHQRTVYRFKFQGDGRYNPRTKDTFEKISILEDQRRNADRPDLVQIRLVTTTMVCAHDPWRDPDRLPCGSIKSEKSAVMTQLDPYGVLRIQLYPPRGSGIPRTSQLTDQERAFLRKQYADYQSKEEELLQGKAKSPENSYSGAFYPSILAPTFGQRVFTHMALPIRLVAPRGFPAQGYKVRLERKDYKGNWVAHTTFAFGAPQAESATGYTGWGTGGTDGRKLELMALPGAWRLSAQPSSPKSSGWSEWVKFVVMAPAVVPGTSNNKLLKPPTRSFGK